MGAESFFSRYGELGVVNWKAAGPANDCTSKLQAAVCLGNLHLEMLAIEIGLDGQNHVVSKDPDLEYVLFGVEVIAGNAAKLQWHEIDGRKYIVIAVPPVLTVQH